MNDLFAELERLVDALESPGVSALARDRAGELVGVVLAIHQDAIERLLDALDDETRTEIAADPRVAPVLLLHGLHPSPLDERVATAVEETRHTLAPAIDVAVALDAGAVVIDLTGPGAEQPEILRAFERAVSGAAPEISDIRVRVPVPVHLTERPTDR